MAPHRNAEIDRFHSPVVATPFAVAESRATFEDWMAAIGASADVVFELAVVFSELLANAVDAAAGSDRQVEASAWVDDGTVVLRVANPIAPGAPGVAPPDLADPLRTGGRGLLIVRAYTDAVVVDADDETVAIHCERRITT